MDTSDNRIRLKDILNNNIYFPLESPFVTIDRVYQNFFNAIKGEVVYSDSVKQVVQFSDSIFNKNYLNISNLISINNSIFLKKYELHTPYSTIVSDPTNMINIFFQTKICNNKYRTFNKLYILYNGTTKQRSSTGFTLKAISDIVKDTIIQKYNSDIQPTHIRFIMNIKLTDCKILQVEIEEILDVLFEPFKFRETLEHIKKCYSYTQMYDNLADKFRMTEKIETNLETKKYGIPQKRKVSELSEVKKKIKKETKNKSAQTDTIVIQAKQMQEKQIQTDTKVLLDQEIQTDTKISYDQQIQTEHEFEDDNFSVSDFFNFECTDKKPALEFDTDSTKSQS